MISLSHLSNSALLLCKDNNNTSNKKNQDCLKEYFEPAEFIRKDPVAWVKSLTPAYREILGINAYLESKYEHNFASQLTKGKMCGYSRETVNRAENIFHTLGVGRIKSCGYNSNEFKISNWFRKNNLAFGMNKLIPAFFCITMLLPAVNVTREYYKDTIYKNIKPNIVAANALERNHSVNESLGNVINRTLSNIGKEKNILKGEIAMQSIHESIFSKEVILRKIARLLNCDVEMVRKLPEISINSMISRCPELRK